MTPADRRAFIDAVVSLPAKHRAWLSLPPGIEGFELFCFYGWGVVLTSAQLEAAKAIFDWPPGAIHLWRFANRTGKTTGLILIHLYIAWLKWRYTNLDFDAWVAYKFRTLHAAPTGRLMGKAWEIADALIAGSAIVQRSDITQTQRRGIFVDTGLWETTREAAIDGSEQLLIKCANGAQVDFLQTRDSGARLESEAWWFIDWDEFVRHQPVGDIPILVDQTFLPRSSDFMAPVVFSGTETDDSAPIYAELEAMVEHSPKDWNLMEFGRSTNFSQTTESIDRQIRVSLDSAVAQRSVSGGAGSGGRGTLLPSFVIKEAFDHSLPANREVGDLPDLPDGKSWKLVSTFDHALSGDLNVMLHAAVPWPITDPYFLVRHPVEAIRMVELRSSGTLTPEQQIRFAQNEVERVRPSVLIPDATAEGGVGVFRTLRTIYAADPMAVRPMNFTARQSQTDRRTTKQVGSVALQRMMSWGLPIDNDEVSAPPEPGVAFGMLRIPFVGQAFRRLFRQLGVLRRDDEKLTQDHAMALLMLCWWLWPYVDRAAPTIPSAFSPFGRRGDRAGAR